MTSFSTVFLYVFHIFLFCLVTPYLVVTNQPSMEWNSILKNWLVTKAKKKNTLISRDEGDVKNLHTGGRKFIFLINIIDFFKKRFTLKKFD